MAAIGDVDETNSAIGVAIVAIGDADTTLVAGLTRIQSDLFDLGAALATPGEDFTPSEMVLRTVPSQVTRQEAENDAVHEMGRATRRERVGQSGEREGVV